MQYGYMCVCCPDVCMESAEYKQRYLLYVATYRTRCATNAAKIYYYCSHLRCMCICSFPHPSPMGANLSRHFLMRSHWLVGFFSNRLCAGIAIYLFVSISICTRLVDCWRAVSE